MAVTQSELILALQTLFSTTDVRLIQRNGLASEVDLATMKAGELAMATDTRALYGCFADGQAEIISGNTFVPLGFYATLSDLQTAHPTGTSGDLYLVGSATPYTIYSWSGSAWTSRGTWNDTSLYATQANLVASYPVGETKIWPFATAPSKHLFLQGSVISRATYPDLWALAEPVAIAEASWSSDKGKFSVGDGSTTFRLPDWSEVVPVGYKSGSTEFGTLGKIYGEKEHTLDITRIPAHSHTPVSPDLFVTYDGATGSAAGTTGGSQLKTQAATATAGGGLAHNNIQPSVAINYIIRALA